MKPQPSSILKNFIVLEGLDGAGTTTQLKLLTALLENTGIPVFSTFEPTDGAVGGLIRAVLKKRHIVQPETLALLFAADREEHLYGRNKGIMAALADGKLVLCDRYLFSSLAYQSVAADFDFVKALNDRFPLPELLVFLDTPLAVCAERRRSRGEAELFEDIDFQRRVALAYDKALSLYSTAGLRRVSIDGTLPPEKIRDEVWTLIASLPIVKR